MASKRPDTKDVQKNKRSKQGLLDVLHSIAKKQEDDRKQYSRQVDYDDVFDSMLTEGTLDGIRLIPPPYLPGRMYELYEQSAILKTCVETYVDNVDGYGYDISSKLSADDNIQKESNPDVQILTEFFDSPNDVETFDRVREKLRRDHEVTGNAFLEVVRGRDSRPVLVFWVDAQRIRITATREPVICTVQVPRGGQLIDIQAEKRFRTFCMVASDGATSGPRVRYFKEYGDPRQLDAVTGQFAKDGENISADRLASELIHFKHGNGVYGIPRWIASLLSVMGSWKANLVNYDLFDNQGIPPLIISVAGGMLTDDSYEDLLNLFRKAKGTRNFHKLLILEAESNGTSVDGKEAAPKLEVKNMTEYRKEDAMFLNYLKNCNEEVQKLGFRLPGMFLGISDDANFATAFIVRKTAEEQLFMPERGRFDEVINKTLVRGLLGSQTDLCFLSKGPTLQSVEDLPAVLTLLVNSGAFTVNGLISFVNEQFGLTISMYENEEWADQPIPKNFTKLPTPAFDAEQDTEDGTIQEEIKKNQKIHDALLEIENVVQKFGNPQHGGCACA